MPDHPRVAAILPCSDLDAAERWWAELGFHRPAGQDYPGYRMVSDDAGAEVHLRAAEPGFVLPGHNPFGVYVYTPRVAELGRTLATRIIEAGGRPEHKPWGMYEFAVNGPDDVLVRIGWPSPLVDPA